MFALPALIFGGPAGVLVDRFDRRTVLWVSNLLRAIVSGIFVLVLVANPPPHQPPLILIYALAFLLATISQFFAPAEGAAIPLLVHPGELINALALFNVTFTLAQVAGLIILGPLVFLLVPSGGPGLDMGVATVPVAPAEVLFTMLAGLYLLCAGLILLIPREELAPVRRAGVPTRPLRMHRDARQIRSIWGGMMQCWWHIRRDRYLLVSVFQLAFAGSFIAVIAMMAPQFVTQFFNQPAALAALVFVPAGAGLVIGSALVPRIHERIGYTRTVFAGVAALSSSTALLPVIYKVAYALLGTRAYDSRLYLALILTLTFIIGVALDLINVPAQNMLQERAPDWIKGRVLAVQALLLNAVTIPFVLIMGRIADVTTLTAAIVVLAVVMATVGFGGVYLSAKRRPRQGVDPAFNAGDPSRGDAGWHDGHNGYRRASANAHTDR
jgi:MFS family permease